MTRKEIHTFHRSIACAAGFRNMPSTSSSDRPVDPPRVESGFDIVYLEFLMARCSCQQLLICTINVYRALTAARKLSQSNRTHSQPTRTIERFQSEPSARATPPYGAILLHNRQLECSTARIAGSRCIPSTPLTLSSWLRHAWDNDKVSNHSNSLKIIHAPLHIRKRLSLPAASGSQSMLPTQSFGGM
ncbi:hypothetical protein SCHPADRAFT_748279 [Schizopora paradoxa]|uniref:Uncharacterized protein n=1 Tax=Schizopora paradoxa TaxID=27342 RepID=A0A0H2R092_9AGAM|nr:hypothetical protein SCHPADRAFT_748279 [Schizopora paradoxa]